MGRKVKYKVNVWCYNQHTCLFLAFCSLLSPSSSSSIGRLSSAASCRRNSHRHCTGSTSKDPSLDWTKSANHGMDWEEACAGLKIHHSYRTHTEGKSRRIICSFFLFKSGSIYVLGQCFYCQYITLSINFQQAFSSALMERQRFTIPVILGSNQVRIASS